MGRPKPAPKKQNHSGKTNLDLLEQEIVSGSGKNRSTCCCFQHVASIRCFDRLLTCGRSLTRSFVHWPLMGVSLGYLREAVIRDAYYFWPTVLSVEPMVQCLVCLSSVCPSSVCL